MFNLSEFSERLEELMIENGLTQSKLAEIINVKASTVSRYLSGQNIPELEIFIRLADYFNCYMDFLAGGTDEIRSTNVTFKQCPPFPTQFKNLLKRYEISRYKLQKDAEISKSIMRYWERERTNPTVENLIKLATRFDCSLDYILGRIDYE